MGELKYAPIYFDDVEILSLLSDEERGRLLMAILDFSAACAKGEEFELSDVYGLDIAGRIAFVSMTKGIERLYETMHVKKTNGSKGGRPKTEDNLPLTETEPNKTEDKPNLTEPKPNVTEPKPNVTEPNLNAEEEEEEKEEEEEDINISCSVPSPVASIPLKDGSEYPVSEAMIKELEPAYPGLDVRLQVLRMEQWARANPGKRKTRRGVPRFIQGWLARAQDDKPQTPVNPFLSMEVVDDDIF